jgi:tetratricopeptide (TPR) repeat protein
MRIQLVICLIFLLPLVALPVGLHAQNEANSRFVQGRTDKRSQLEELKRNLRDRPHDGDPNDLRIQIITLLLDLKGPFTEILDIIDIDSRYPNKMLFARVATLLADRKEYLDQALQLIDKAISAPRIPNDAIPYYKFDITRGYVYLQRGEIDKALEIFTRLQKQMPQDETLLTYLGMAYQRAGRIDEAINTYFSRQVFTITPLLLRAVMT